jgi:hypothetical protein
MRTAKAVLLSVLALGLICTISGCTSTTAVSTTSSPTQTDLYQVVKVGNKQLTFGPSVLSGDRYTIYITITVINSGQEMINQAQFDVVLRAWEWEVDEENLVVRMGETEEGRFRVAVEKLSPGQVRSLVFFGEDPYPDWAMWISVEDVNIK